MFSQCPKNHRIFKRQTKALISLRVGAGCSEPLLVAHTTLLEISCCGSYACLHCNCHIVILHKIWVKQVSMIRKCHNHTLHNGAIPFGLNVSSSLYIVYTPKSVIEPNMNTLSQNVKEEFALRARNNWWLDGRTGQITRYPTFPTKMYLSPYH